MIAETDFKDNAVRLDLQQWPGLWHEVTIGLETTYLLDLSNRIQRF